mmetsp:Transcript_7585/g.15268  ORF Transcript_7585/g.15268 Transcript_7585/m.15268 type:complete len:351 (+) Transcript_7585:1075-2127(+)
MEAAPGRPSIILVVCPVAGPNRQRRRRLLLRYLPHPPPKRRRRHRQKAQQFRLLHPAPERLPPRCLRLRRRRLRLRLVWDHQALLSRHFYPSAEALASEAVPATRTRTQRRQWRTRPAAAVAAEASPSICHRWARARREDSHPLASRQSPGGPLRAEVLAPAQVFLVPVSTPLRSGAAAAAAASGAAPEADWPPHPEQRRRRHRQQQEEREVDVSIPPRTLTPVSILTSKFESTLATTTPARPIKVPRRNSPSSPSSPKAFSSREPIPATVLRRDQIPIWGANMLAILVASSDAMSCPTPAPASSSLPPTVDRTTPSHPPRHSVVIPERAVYWETGNIRLPPTCWLSVTF